MTPRAVPKLCGADVELGNYVVGARTPGGTGREAARDLLAAMADVAGGVGRFAEEPCRAESVQDWGRVFLSSNGGCAYIDLDHLELCLPEVLSASAHVAAWRAMLRLAQAALARANARRDPDRPLRVLVNNSDGHGHTYGSHLDVLVSRRMWNDLMERKLHHLAFLVAHQASAVVLTGQGKVGSESGPPARYQLSQRADFIEMLTGPQTTWRRPLVNTRDEPLCGGAWEVLAEPGHPAASLARLHVICHDSTLCDGASYLKVGMLQVVLAMLEAQAVPALALEDPLTAVRVWSRDPTLRARVPLVGGRRVTVVDLQQRILDAACTLAERGGLLGVVPDADRILGYWADTLERLRRREWPELARRLDWVLKLGMLERAMHQDPTVGWDSERLKLLDHLYSSLDPAEGLFWIWERAGRVDQLVSEDAVEWLTREPPEDTRAWTRAMLLRRAGTDAIEHVDWDHIHFGLGGGGVRLPLPDPLGWTRAQVEPVMQVHARLAPLLDALGAERIPPPRRRRTKGGERDSTRTLPGR